MRIPQPEYQRPETDPFQNNGQRSNYVFPPVIDGNSIRFENIVLPKEIISGMFSLTEKLELAGGSKSFKTWSFIDMSVSVCNGAPWWSRPTERTHVVYLNMELSQPFFEQRLKEVSEARELEPNSRFHVIHLRGAKLHQPPRWEAFLGYLESLLHRFPEPLLIADPIYKMLGGKSENSAGDINAMMDQLEDLIQRTKGANTFGHHFAKGNAADKDAIDRASGSGVFQRDPDVLLVMSRNETQDCYTVETFLRNHKPIEKFVLYWDYPLFVVRNDVDPDDLKKPKGRPSKFKPYDLVQILGNLSLRTVAFQIRAKEEKGISPALFYELLEQAARLNLIHKSVITEEWEIVRHSTNSTK